MNLERAIIIIIWLLGIGVIAWLVPRASSRKFLFGFLVCHTLTWVNVALHVKLSWLAYPVREFPKAADMGFTMQYMVYPCLCGLYLIFEPRRSWTTRAVYLIVWCFVLAWFHHGLARYTELVEYVHYHWSMAWIAFIVIFGCANAIVRCFFKEVIVVNEKETMP